MHNIFHWDRLSGTRRLSENFRIVFLAEEKGDGRVFFAEIAAKKSPGIVF
jgi:hypothetical protein